MPVEVSFSRKIVIRAKALGTLENDGGVVGFKFQTRKLIRVERRLQGVEVDIIEFLHLRLIVDGRRIVDDDAGFLGLAGNQAASSNRKKLRML